MRLLSLLMLSIVGTSCSRYYTYSFQMVAPEEKQELVYEDENLRMRFEPTENMISFRIDNKTDDGIKMPWDDISLDVNGNSKRIVHKETGIRSTQQIQPPTTITPKGYLLDALIPTDNVRYITTKGITTAIYTPLFPIVDNGSKKLKKKAMSWKGADLTLYFPLIKNEDRLKYTVRLKVLDVLASKKKPKAKQSILLAGFMP